MTEVRFYHLTRTSLDRALPELLEKCLTRGWRSVVLTSSRDRVEHLDDHLWTYDKDAYSKASFLPHGSARDGQAADQPIWITDIDENPNAASVLFLTAGTSSTRVADYRFVCDLFDGRDPESVAAARERWRAIRAAGHTLAYWQQGETGGWQEKQRIDGTSTA